MVWKGLILLGGYGLTVFGAGWLINPVIKRMIRKNNLSIRGLRGGGRLIGWLERSLIFLLFIIGQPGGIGFLVAAKSILRFEESKREAIGEYVLIGTLFSFTLAILFTHLTIRLLGVKI
jgi:hypothetical protein